MARSSKAIPWLLFAGGGTVTAFILPVMILITGLFALFGVFSGALSYETMQAFVGNWLIKIILFGILFLTLWHAAHRLRVVAHDFGIRADTGVAIVVYGLATVGTVATVIALLSV
jgi:fumarate reductase subunit D